MLRLRAVASKIIVLVFLSFIITPLDSYSQLSVEMLIIGGGGGGGSNAGSNSSGGGGASGGEVVYSTTTCSANDVLTVVVGSGGFGFRFSPSVTQTNGNSSTVTQNSTTWTAIGGNTGGSATSSSSSGTGGTSVNTDLSGAGGRGGIYNNGNNPSGWPVSGGNGTSSYSDWGAATSTGQNSGGIYYYAGGGAGGNWGGQSGGGDAAAGLGGGGGSNADASANTGGGGGGANSNGSSGMNIPGGNGGSGLVIIRYSGTPVATGGTITQSGGYTYHTFTSTGTLTLNATLPVHLISFTGTNTLSGQQLNWDVQNEQDFSHYEVETSTDASTFKSIGSVTAANKEQYSFTNSNPAPAQNYYRLKMVDIDDVYTYSKVIMLLNKGDQQSIRIYPNPTSSTLNISSKNEMKDVILTDANGNQVMHTVVNSNTISLNISQLVPGIYQVQIVTTNGVIVERVTKIK